jgi:hypothetical protein
LALLAATAALLASTAIIAQLVTANKFVVFIESASLV